MAGFQLPTGYEQLQRQAELKHKLAEAMMERGLSQGQDNSWTQVLAQLGSALAGKHLEKKADALDSQVSHQMLTDWGGRVSAFENDAKTLSPTDLVQKYAGDPLISQTKLLDPYQSAMSDILKQKFRPTNPNDMVVETDDPSHPGQKTWSVNPLRVSAAQQAQGFGMHEGDPMPMSMPSPDNPAPAGGPTGAPAGGLSPPSAGAMNLDLLTPEEKSIMTTELQRRAAIAGGQPAHVVNDMSKPFGSPLTARRAPDGIAGNKPYWLINGVPYDNPEGN